MFAAMPPDQATRLGDTLGELATASDEEVCWAGKTLYAQASTMPEPTRSALFRAFVEP